MKWREVMNYFVVFLMIIQVVLLVFVFFYVKQAAWFVAKIAAQFLYDPDTDPNSLSCTLSEMKKTMEAMKNQIEEMRANRANP
jgi:hypothetical protein